MARWTPNERTCFQTTATMGCLELHQQKGCMFARGAQDNNTSKLLRWKVVPCTDFLQGNVNVKDTAMTDFELQSIEHHNALLSEEYNAHPRKTSFSESTANIMRSSHPQWKIGVRYCALSGGLVFLMNTIFLLVGESCAGFPALSSNGGKRILYSGHCDTTKNLNIGVHLLINLLSTVLLGASNYCMQCMSAPTRAEVDRSHTRFKWVDIGIPSIRNLSRIRGLRVVLWLLLGLSSLPLHLL